MIHFNKKLFRLCLGLITTLALFVACTKDGNPNNLPTTIPESEYAGKSGNDVIKILAIGNSFSENAIESNLYDLAKEAGKKVIIGNMYIGGASLELHVRNATNNGSVYEYRKINTDGVKKTYAKVSIATVLADEHWDYISFQQASPFSGLTEPTLKDLEKLFNYVQPRATNPNVKYLYHQTWAYAPTTSHTGFANYNNDQLTMYNGIVNVSENVKTVVPIDIVVPAGTAIQDARTSLLNELDETFTVLDGYHLNELGKYIAACTWFQTLFGQSPVGMTYRPSGYSNFEIAVAQNAANLATEKPLQVTFMEDFQTVGPLNYPVLIDFGSPEASPSWNWVSSVMTGTRITLNDSLTNFVGLSLKITERFQSTNSAGATGTNTILNMPDNVSKNNFFGNAKAWGNNVITPQSSFVISGLDKKLTYNFCFFGSRSAGNNRETKYTVTGEVESSASLNAGSNATVVACINSVKPNAQGKVTVSVTAGPNNATNEKFFYLNAARITSNN